MAHMEHMEMRWKVQNRDGLRCIVTDEESEPWYIATVQHGLPDDDSGEITAQAICDLHNAMLEKGEQDVQKN